MSFPMEVARVSLDHQGGTKSYHTTIVATADNKAMLIKRWGKTGAFGDILVEEFFDVGAGELALQRVLRDKERKGYRRVSSDTKNISDQAELIKAVGRPTWAKLSVQQIQLLLPNASVAGVREPEPNRFDEDGKFLGNPEPRKIVITEEMKEQARVDRINEMRAKNPNYGRF